MALTLQRGRRRGRRRGEEGEERKGRRRGGAEEEEEERRRRGGGGGVSRWREVRDCVLQDASIQCTGFLLAVDCSVCRRKGEEGG